MYEPARAEGLPAPGVDQLASYVELQQPPCRAAMQGLTGLPCLTLPCLTSPSPPLQYTVNFLNLLIDQNRIEALDEICESFEKSYCALTDTQVGAGSGGRGAGGFW